MTKRLPIYARKVFVMTRAEFQRSAQVKTSLAASVEMKGKLLYKRP